MSERYDPAQGRRAEVERLLQVLAVLRDADGGWVPRERLRTRVTEYTVDRAPEALEKMVERDLETLRHRGFDLQSDTASGAPARDRLGTSSFRLPVDLDPTERTLLAWVTAQSVDAGGVLTDPDLPSRRTMDAVADLVGTPPRAIALVHAALAGRRALVLLDDGVEKVAHPVQLVVRGPKWFLLLRFPGRETTYGYRLERLEVLRLGERVPAPEPVSDVDAVLSALSWDKGPVVEVEIGCASAHLARVRRDFPGFAVTDDGHWATLVGTTTHVGALVDRVLGHAGRAVVRSPGEVVDRVVAAARAVVAS